MIDIRDLANNTLPTSLAEFTGVAYSLLRFGLSIGLLILLIPALLLSLLLFIILVSPILIASLIYLNGLENLRFFSFVSVLESVADDLIALPGRLESSTETPQNPAISSTPRTVPVSPRRGSFISDFGSSREELLADRSSYRRYGTALEGSRSASGSCRKAIPDFEECDSPGSMLCNDGKNSDIPRSPHTEPFDLMEKDFSPHWSAGRPIHWSPSPSPLNISFTGPTSPVHWPSPAIGSESPSGRSPTHAQTDDEREPSPFRLESAVKDAMDEKITPLLMLPSSKAHFSTSLPRALRNIKNISSEALELADESFSSQGDDSLEMLVPKLDVKSMPDNRKQALILEFKKVIAELESTLEKQDEDDYTEELLTVAPTPPPRPTTFPRNRMARANAKSRLGELNPKLFLPPPRFDLSPRDTGRRSPAADGLYGADNADADYWNGFDQTYNVHEHSFESVASEEDLKVIQWKNKGKWIEKGVNVLSQLDEESLGSNSSLKISPPSKKEVRWRDEERPTSPVAEFIPSINEPLLPDSDSETPDILVPLQPSSLLFNENNVPGHEEENLISSEKIKEMEDGRKHQISPVFQTPTRQALAAAQNANREIPPTSPISPLTGSVSGKLIKLFEDLSKNEPRSPSRSGSPTHSVGRLDSVAVEKMMSSARFVMDGTTDGTAEGDKKETATPEQTDGACDGLDECF